MTARNQFGNGKMMPIVSNTEIFEFMRDNKQVINAIDVRFQSLERNISIMQVFF